MNTYWTDCHCLLFFVILPDTLPSLLDEVHDSKGCTKPAVRTEEEAAELDVSHKDEESTCELGLNQTCTYEINSQYDHI